MHSRRIKPSGKVFRDPIHQLIRIDKEDEFLLRLIDTPEFQRLRRIRQLGVSWLTYPGAEHSRFVHSLGVLNFTQRILEVLRRRYAGSDPDVYLQKHGKTVKAAALLHDIGHGPFSHMIERAFGKKSNHEQKTIDIIKDPNSAVASILTNNGIFPDDVADIIQHTSRHQLLTDLVTSQLDADRMDYLLRDSYCTGVQYGRYDAEWLLNAMCIGRNPLEIDGEPWQSWRLALDERRGEKAAEQFILARAHMNEQVYFHRVTRGFEALLLNIFQLAVASARNGTLPVGTPDVVTCFFSKNGAINKDQWLAFDESVIISALHIWASRPFGMDQRLSALSAAFLNRESVYSSVSVRDIKLIDFRKICDELKNNGMKEHADWCTDDIDSAVYKGILYSNQSGSGSNDEEASVESILLATGKPSDKARAIESNSGLMSYLDKKRSSITRIYFDRSRTNDVRPVFKNFKISLDSGGEES